jgi:hypothetical protein
MNPEVLTPAKTKMRRLIGRAKSAKKPPTSATKAQAPAVTDLQETLRTSVAEIAGQVPTLAAHLQRAPAAGRPRRTTTDQPALMNKPPG